MTTERLHLVPLKESDIDFFQLIIQNSHVRKYLCDDTIMPFDVFRQILDDVALHFKTDRWALWKITILESSGVIGYAGLWPFFNENQPQLLYPLLPEHFG